MPSAGDTIAGKYYLHRELGAGGMGVVFAATNISTEANVAIKFLNAQHAKNGLVAGRFMREAKAAGRLRSRYVARVFDADRSAEGDPFIVMELLSGQDLESALDAGPMPVPRACALLVQACAGVDEAHRAGIVHRDLKPANLFLASEGNEIVKVLDFGVSKVEASTDGDPTGAAAILGTVRFMSPEHFIDARSVDARTDVWALGVILFQALEGRMPFEGDGPALIAAVLAPSSCAPRVTRHDVPPSLVDIVARCLAKNRDERVSSVAELAELVAPFAPPGAIADALGEIRGRRHASTPRDGVPAVGVDVMGATMVGLGAPTPAAGSAPHSHSHSPSGPHSVPRSFVVAPTESAAPSRSIHVDPTGGPTSHSPSGATGSRASSTNAFVVGGLALTMLVLAFALLTRSFTRREPARVPLPSPLESAAQAPVATPPATVSIIILSAPPPPTVSAPPPVPSGSASPAAKPKTSTPPRPHGPGTSSIPTLL